MLGHVAMKDCIKKKKKQFLNISVCFKDKIRSCGIKYLKLKPDGNKAN